MSVVQSRDNRTFEAYTDLSAEQFKFVEAGEVNPAGEIIIQVTQTDGGAGVLGVLNSGAPSFGACTVTVTGRTMVQASGNIGAGAPVTSDASGLARKGDQVGDTVLGTCVKACSTGGYAEIELFLGGNVVEV